MKSKIILLGLYICFGLQQMHSQFFSKLTKKIEQKVENVVIDKTVNKSAEKTSKSMDKVFDIKPFEKGDVKADPSNIPDSYKFSWKYSMKMTTKEGEIVFDYFLESEQPYFGFNMPKVNNNSTVSNDIFMVMDNDLKVTIMYMKSDKNSMMMVNEMADDLDLEETADTSTTYKYETLPNKKIMGYMCKGVKATNDEHDITMYFTNEAPVSFNDIYKNKQSNIPEGLKKHFKENEKTLMLEMTMKDKKKRKNDTTMECISLEKVKKKINKSDYK